MGKMFVLHRDHLVPQIFLWIPPGVISEYRTSEHHWMCPPQCYHMSHTKATSVSSFFLFFLDKGAIREQRHLQIFFVGWLSHTGLIQDLFLTLCSEILGETKNHLVSVIKSKSVIYARQVLYSLNYDSSTAKQKQRKKPLAYTILFNCKFPKEHLVPGMD